MPALLARAGQAVAAVGEQIRAMCRSLAAAAGTGDQVLTALRGAQPEPAPGFVRYRDHVIPEFVTGIAAELTVPAGAKVAGVLSDAEGPRAVYWGTYTGTGEGVARR